MTIPYEVLPLSIFAEVEEVDVLATAVRASLASFECPRSSLIQKFIATQAFEAERSGWTRTFIFLSERGDGIDVPAFLSVGLTAVRLERDGELLSGKQHRKVFGSHAHPVGGVVGSYCIAELARNGKYDKTDLPGSVILDEAKAVISEVQKSCGGRIVTVDARPRVFESLYQPQGFRQVSTRESPNDDEDEDFVVACCSIKDWVAAPAIDPLSTRDEAAPTTSV